jgi:hypothetical protein
VVPERVLECVREFHSTSAGGMSGLRPAHLRFLLLSATHVDILQRMADIVNRLLEGSLPPLARARVCGANLTALVKKDGGLRPIACGDVWRRLAARCVCKNFAADFRSTLAPFQFGVAVSGGAEILAHTARFLFEMSPDRRDFLLLKFDFKNAFNCVARQFFLDDLPQANRPDEYEAH